MTSTPEDPRRPLPIYHLPPRLITVLTSITIERSVLKPFGSFTGFEFARAVESRGMPSSVSGCFHSTLRS